MTTAAGPEFLTQFARVSLVAFTAVLAGCLSGGGASLNTSNPESSVTPDLTSTAKALPVSIAPASSSSESQPMEQSRYGERALAYLEQNRGEYRIADPRSELRFASETTDELNHKHVRFQQVYKSVPVWRREILVHFNDRDEVRTVSNGLVSGLGLIDITPRVTTEAAGRTAAQAKGEGWQTSGGVLYVFLHELRPTLVYEVTVTRGFERWFVFVDASNGQVIHQISGSPSAR